MNDADMAMVILQQIHTFKTETKTMIRVMNRNMIATMSNGRITSQQTNAILKPLCNPTTGEAISNFPKDIPALNTLREEQIQQILRDLEEEPATLPRAMYQLKEAIGLTFL